MNHAVKAVLFDFGGVIAEEGFREGLMAIAEKNGIPSDMFYDITDRIIFETGYLTGTADEATFWNAVRSETGIAGTDAELREEILKRFIIRPEMVDYAERVRSKGPAVAMLSDQTNWLEEIDARTALFTHFDTVFNSYRTHKSKRDPSVFTDVCAVLGVPPAESLFVDDNIRHIERARSRGLQTIHFTTIDAFTREITGFL